MPCGRGNLDFVWHPTSCPRFLTRLGVLNMFHLVVINTRNINEADFVKIFPWILWHLWKARNALVFEETKYDSVSILSRATKDVDPWFSVNNPDTGSSALEIQSMVHSMSWKRSLQESVNTTLVLLGRPALVAVGPHGFYGMLRVLCSYIVEELTLVLVKKRS